MFRLSAFSAFSLVLLIFLSSCRHDPELPPIIPGVNDSICFDNQVMPIISTKCANQGCHDGGGEKFPLLTYDEVYNNVAPGNPNKSIIYTAITANQLSGNIMPPSGYPLLSNADITIIQLWIMEGAYHTKCSGVPCDSTNVTFNGTIMPIIVKNCQGSCHSGSNPSQNLLLTTYPEVKAATENKFLLDHLLNQNGKSLMPKGYKLSDCNIAQFKKWISDGKLP